MRGLLKPFFFLCEKPIQLFDQGGEFLLVFLILNLSTQLVHALTFFGGQGTSPFLRVRV